MPDWDKIFTDSGHVFREPHPDIPRVTEFMRERSVKRVLDVGCGTGRHLVYLAKQGFEVTGFDASPRAIQLAEEWLEKDGLHAELVEHRMEQPFPYDDKYFDAVISIQTIHHNLVRNIRFTIQEIERVLRQSGIVFITVAVFAPGPVLPEKDWKLRAVEGEDMTFIPEAGPESGIPHHYFSCGDIMSEFREFELVELYIDETKHRAFLGTKREV